MKDFSGVDFNPKTQGKVHPLQGEGENFLGYFTEELFSAIEYRSKRIVHDDPDNPYKNLYPTLRPHAVFVDHNEALEKWNELYILGKPGVDREAVKVAFGEKCRVIASETLRRRFQLEFILTILFGIVAVAVIPLWQMAEIETRMVSAGSAILVTGFLFLAFRTFQSYLEMRKQKRGY